MVVTKPVTNGLLAAALTLSLSNQSFAQDPNYGMVTHYVDTNMANAMVTLGAGVVRIDIDWSIMEPSQGTFNWYRDTDVWNARSNGLAVLASLSNTPGWANGGQPGNVPPLLMQDWSNFAYAVAAHYQGLNQDIGYFGVWNEPDNPGNFSGSLQQYGDVLTAGYFAIKDANPSATVLGPEVGWGGVCNGWFATLMADFGNAIDIATVHYYLDACTDPGTFMDAYVSPNLQGKPVWMTETGMNVCDPGHYGNGETWQQGAYDTMLQAYLPRKGSYWTAIFFYDLYEPTNNCPNFAAIRPDWSTRPAFSDYQSWIQTYP